MKLDLVGSGDTIRSYGESPHIFTVSDPWVPGEDIARLASITTAWSVSFLNRRSSDP